MAISKVVSDSAPTTASSGTALTNTTQSLTAGDLIVAFALVNPSSANVTWDQNGGTGTAAFSTAKTYTKLTNGSVIGLSVAVISVTANGTVGVRATSNATIVSAILSTAAYRGASGAGKSNTITGSSGTDVAPNIASTDYANSWCVMCAGTAATTTAYSAGTSTTSRQAGTVNISGTADDMAAFIGDSNGALSIHTNETLHGTQASNKTYAAIIIELVQQFTISASGGAAGSQADKASSVKSITVTEGAIAAKVASANKSITVTESASHTHIASSVKSGSATESSAASRQVLTNFTDRNESQTAAASKISSSVRQGSASLSSAGQQIASSVKAAIASEHSAGSVQVTSNLKTLPVSYGALASTIASSVILVAGVSHSEALRIASSVFNTIASYTFESDQSSSNPSAANTSGVGDLSGLAFVIANSVRRSDPMITASAALSISRQAVLSLADYLFEANEVASSAGQTNGHTESIVSVVASSVCNLTETYSSSVLGLVLSNYNSRVVRFASTVTLRAHSPLIALLSISIPSDSRTINTPHDPRSMSVSGRRLADANVDVRSLNVPPESRTQ